MINNKIVVYQSIKCEQSCLANYQVNKKMFKQKIAFLLSNKEAL